MIKTNKSEVFDISDCVWIPGPICILLAYAVLIGSFLLTVYFSTFPGNFFVFFGSYGFLAYPAFYFVVYFLVHYAFRKSNLVPLDWRLYTFFKTSSRNYTLEMGENIRRYLAEKYNPFWLPRILRPRSYGKSFVLLLLNIVVWIAIYIFVSEHAEHFSAFGRLYATVIKLVAKLPGGDFILGVLFIVPLGLAYFVWVFIRPDARSAFRAKDDSIVLYLRPFSLDEVEVEHSEIGLFGFQNRKARELQEVLVNIFRKISFFVAIGDPKERFPSLGALKSYFGDEEWRENVVMWMGRSNLIVAIVCTEETIWELKQIIEKAYIHKTILLFPHLHGQNLARGTLADDVWRLNLDVFADTIWNDALNDVASKTSGAPIAIRLCEDGQVEAVSSDNVTESHYRAALMHFSAQILTQ